MYSTVMINCLLESNQLGRGKTIGAGFHWDDDVDGLHRSFLESTMVFDDVPQYPTRTTQISDMINRSEDPINIPESDIYEHIAFASSPSPTPSQSDAPDIMLSGFGIFPFGRQTKFYNEAIESFAHRWFPTLDLRQFRTNFLLHLKSVIGLHSVLNNNFDLRLYEDEPIENTVCTGTQYLI